MFKLRRGRDPAARQALPQAGPGQLGRAVHRRVHVAARAAAEPARAARHRHLRRRRQRGGRLQGVHPGRVAVQREGRQAVQAALRVPHLRHGQRRLHLQRRAVPGPENDGRQQPEGHAAAADRRQDHPVRRQGRGRQDLVRGVLQRGGQHRHTQEDGGRRVGAAPRPRGETCLGFTTSAKFQGSHVAHVALLPAPHSATRSADGSRLALRPIRSDLRVQG